MKMRRKNKAVGGLFLLAAAIFVAAAVLAGTLFFFEKGENLTVHYLVSAKNGITGEEFSQFQELPGLVKEEWMIQVQTAFSIGAYEGEGELYGVDLEEYPFLLSASSGEVSFGNQALLVLGNGAMEGLLDFNGSRISNRRKALLQEKPEEIKIRLEGNAEGKILGITGDEKEKDGKLYGDFSQVKAYAESRKKEVLFLVWLAVSGKEEANAAKESLIEAGYTVEEIARVK